MLDEQSPLGDSFLAEVAREWEEACRPAIEAGIRVVNARFGVVLSPRGGALQKMLLPAKFAGGALGNGKQWWSWIALDDVIGAIYHAITDPTLSGSGEFCFAAADHESRLCPDVGGGHRSPRHLSRAGRRLAIGTR